jgi:predicted anti-sigma-YlaC factor YlaD
MKAPDSELRRLTDAWHDGTISPADAARLEERLLNDPAARDYYLEISALEGNLPDAASASHATSPARTIVVEGRGYLHPRRFHRHHCLERIHVPDGKYRQPTRPGSKDHWHDGSNLE